ncbi:dihydrodipicolinate synthase family protein [Alicyclobacillus dauci]|uniref:Dihydrodipicolinate synthase family protein n=1 Tax=Alicyclobacillus dauci TaxID=1475485 RepID=A0ABY6Z2R6_9BACL|nr:dihydrodipicolinate synthase family protein [Alicyclobacillus dauci]WAH37126.1 dihydrodipicolinate synthase family protein [Alicyclobacillus dauci]
MAEQGLTGDKFAALHEGLVIPAHPLALTSDRKLDEIRQRALTRYYMAAGAGGVAVGVHSTQFEIRDPQFNLLEPVLQLAAEEIARAQLDRPVLKICGICGPTSQAIKEAELGVKLGYDMGLVSMGGLSELSEAHHLERIKEVAQVIPVFGFYLQPSVGGRIFTFDFWRKFVEIPGVMAVKIAPFNRYYAIDVVRAVCDSERRDEIALYTGNDDNIINDLLTTYRFKVNGEWVEKRIVGGLLGHWAVWTRKAVEMFEELKESRRSMNKVDSKWLTKNIEVTDCNAAFFDPFNHFTGSIPGIHEVLRRQGLLEGRWCLNPNEVLSPGQLAEIDRVYRDYPHLNDDEFIKANLNEWLGA